MPDPPFEREAAHKWFAIELNNSSWGLLEKADRTADESDDLIHGAHASCFHWKKAGNHVNHCRALCLVANAYTSVGIGNAALQFANRCVEMIEAKSDDYEDWDIAFAVDAQARACLVSGDQANADAYRANSRELGDAIAGAEDKKVFDDWFENWG